MTRMITAAMTHAPSPTKIAQREEISAHVEAFFRSGGAVDVVPGFNQDYVEPPHSTQRPAPKFERQKPGPEPRRSTRSREVGGHCPDGMLREPKAAERIGYGAAYFSKLRARDGLQPPEPDFMRKVGKFFYRFYLPETVDKWNAGISRVRAKPKPRGER